MMAYSWMDVVSIALNLIFGGGFIITLLTLRSQKKKANAEAKGAEATAEGTELDNVTKAISNWREEAEYFKKELGEARSNYSEVTAMVVKLQKSVDRLNYTNMKILKLLDKISHDNLETTVAEIKNEIKKSDE